jgi:uncharacterized protein
LALAAFRTANLALRLPAVSLSNPSNGLWPVVYNGPMKPLKTLAKNRNKILQLARLHGATRVRVFGSVARGEADHKSDIDFLVQMEPGRTLLDMGGLLMDLQRTLGRPVDVVTEKGLKGRIRERVLREAVPLGRNYKSGPKK